MHYWKEYLLFYEQTFIYLVKEDPFGPQPRMLLDSSVILNLWYSDSGTLRKMKSRSNIDPYGWYYEAYEIKYCCRCFVLVLLFSFRKAHISICRTLSRLTPMDSPISCKVFILPSSIPNLHLITCLSLGLKLSNTLSRSSFINCFLKISSDVSASGSAINSWKTIKMTCTNQKLELKSCRMLTGWNFKR